MMEKIQCILMYECQTRGAGGQVVGADCGGIHAIAIMADDAVYAEQVMNRLRDDLQDRRGCKIIGAVCNHEAFYGFPIQTILVGQALAGGEVVTK